MKSHLLFIKHRLLFNIIFILLFSYLHRDICTAGTKIISIQLNINDILYSKNMGYDVLGLRNCEEMVAPSKIGEPMLPVKRFRVLLPSGTAVTSIKVISNNKISLDGNYFIQPIQPTEYINSNQTTSLILPKKDIYEQDADYPRSIVESRGDAYFREYHLAEIMIYPFQYNPKQQKISFFSDITIEIEYTNSSKFVIGHRLRQNEINQNNIREKLKHLILNPEDVITLDERNISTKSISNSNIVITHPFFISQQPSAIEGLNVDYVIITNDILSPSFQQLADYKTKKGIVATIKTTSWISNNYPGVDLQEKIRHFIQDVYINWGTEYVLLGGDVDIIPSRKIYSMGSLTETPLSDLYYSAIFPISDNWNSNGDNNYGDVTCPRLMCQCVI